MKEAQERVRRFHEAMAKLGARGDVGDFASPGLSDDAAELRARLLMEECVETCMALLHGNDKGVLEMYDDAMHAWFMKRAGRGRLTDGIEGVADGLADVIVIALGTAVAAGIALQPVFDEVMAANERKVEPSARIREDGKLLKPDGWIGPDVAAVLARQKAGAR